MFGNPRAVGRLLCLNLVVAILLFSLRTAACRAYHCRHAAKHAEAARDLWEVASLENMRLIHWDAGQTHEPFTQCTWDFAKVRKDAALEGQREWIHRRAANSIWILLDGSCRCPENGRGARATVGD